MSWDDDLKHELGATAGLMPIDNTGTLAAAKSRGRRLAVRRRVLAASGGVLTASALLVGALSLASGPDEPTTVVAGEVQLPASTVARPEPAVPPVCAPAFPTMTGEAADRFVPVDESTWEVDGQTITTGDERSGTAFRRRESRLVWMPIGDVEREAMRTLYTKDDESEVVLEAQYLPEGCRLVIHLDSGEGAVLEEFRKAATWPASNEPEPIVIDDPNATCGPVAPFQSAELDAQFGPPEVSVGAEGGRSMVWADEDSSVTVKHPAVGGEAPLGAVPLGSLDPETASTCESASLTTTGSVSVVEASSALRPVDPGLVGIARRSGGIDTEVSSAVEVAPDSDTSVD